MLSSSFSKGTGIPTNMGLDHIGIVVPNAQQAADFLIEVFDAEFDWEVKREASPNAGARGWSELFGIHPDAYMPHVIMLKCGEQVLTQYIELFEWHSPEQYQPQSNCPKFSDIGNSYISFTVQDLKQVMEHIKINVLPKWQGTRFIQDPPMQFPLRGEICTSTFLVSPWGMWIELTCWSESQKKGKVIKAQQREEKNPFSGKPIACLPTPSFLIDLDIVDHNINLMKSRIHKHDIAWRIPAKAHKCPELAQYILQRGNACGVVLLTLDEAEQFAARGITNIYLANQFSNQQEFIRLSLLAKKVSCLRVAIDDADCLQNLAQAIQKWEIITPVEVLIELNINHNRCGVNHLTEAVALAQLAKQIETTTGAVIFAGITGYEGHTPLLSPPDKTRETAISHHLLASTKAAIEAAGIVVNVVSGGGSCNYMDCLQTGVLTEIQAGGGVIGDLLYCQKANLHEHGHKMGASVLAQIVSVPADQSRATANAGFKASGWHPMGGLPQPRDRTDLQVVGLSAEHTRLMAHTPGQAVDLARGEKIILIPGYTDAMGFLYDQIYGIRHGIVEHIWDTV